MDELLHAYLKTEIILRGIDGIDWGTVADDVPGSISLTRGAFELLGLDCDSAFIITAWNPLGQKLPQSQNDVLQSSLEMDLRGRRLEFVSVVGQEPGGGWKEDSLLVPNTGSPEIRQKVLELADKFAQNAIFELTLNTKRLIGVRIPYMSGEAGYRLLPLGTQGIDLSS
jgi:hypothetical protein